MESEDVAVSIASLEKGAENTDKFLDRLERGLDLVERELKELKESRLGVEKQYEAMFAELQHKLNEVHELRDNLKALAVKSKEREVKTKEAVGKLKDEIDSFQSNCDTHKEKTKEKSAWYLIKNETGLALRVVWTFFAMFMIGAIIGWEKFAGWVLGLAR